MYLRLLSCGMRCERATTANWHAMRMLHAPAAPPATAPVPASP